MHAGSLKTCHGRNVVFIISHSYAVYPTPVIGMLGLIEDVDKIMTSYFKKEGDIILILGKPVDENSKE
ncbi:MAG: hypothetical protein R3A12_06380 [Ignavibacteria bacterium]